MTIMKAVCCLTLSLFVFALSGCSGFMEKDVPSPPEVGIGIDFPEESEVADEVESEVTTGDVTDATQEAGDETLTETQETEDQVNEGPHGGGKPGKASGHGGGKPGKAGSTKTIMQLSE